MSLGPFDLTGGPFLALYGALLALTILAGFLIPRWLRIAGRPNRVLDGDQLAVLAGGASRLAETIVTRLLTRRALALVDRKRFEIRSRSGGQSAAEISVLTLPEPASWTAIARTVKPYVEPAERKLIAAGLLMEPGLTLQMRFWQTLPYLLLLAFGATKWEIGTLREKPVGYLTILLVVTAVLAVMRWFAVDRRTQGGHDALAAARAQSERLRRAPTPAEADVAVALFGTVVLAGSGWSDFHQLRTSGSGDGGGGGSSDGGSGCGGGGCGGCGG